MNKVVDIDDIMPLIEEQLSHDGQVTFTPKGNSMLPLLRNNKDQVTLKKPQLPLKKYDVAFYQRKNGNYVLHRVVGLENDTYVMRGDHQLLDEHGITDSQIIAVLENFTRKGKKYYLTDRRYILYSKLWINTVKVRRMYRIGRRIAGKIKRKILGRSR